MNSPTLTLGYSLAISWYFDQLRTAKTRATSLFGMLFIGFAAAC
jgi:hypothetical protein